MNQSPCERRGNNGVKREHSKLSGPDITIKVPEIEDWMEASVLFQDREIFGIETIR